MLQQCIQCIFLYTFNLGTEDVINIQNSCIMKWFILKLMQLFKFSPKRLFLINTLRREMAKNTGKIAQSLRMLCPTRQTVRHRSIHWESIKLFRRNWERKRWTCSQSKGLTIINGTVWYIFCWLTYFQQQSNFQFTYTPKIWLFRKQ